MANIIACTRRVQMRLVEAVGNIPEGTSGSTSLLLAAIDAVAALDRVEKARELLADPVLDDAAKLALIDAFLR